MPHLAAVVIFHRLANLCGIVHDEWALTDDGLIDRLAAK
jgi:hypothetical protein